MTKDIKYIIKRILIGTGIILLLTLIKMTSVSAKTITGENNIRYDYPFNQDVEDYNNFLFSNFATGMLDNNTLFAPKGNFFAYYSSISNPSNWSLDITLPDVPLASSDITIFKKGHYYPSEYSNYFVNVYSFDFIPNTWTNNNNTISNFPINANNEYELLIEIKKSDNLTFNDDNVFTNDSVVLSSSGDTENNKLLQVINVDYITPDKIDGNSNYAYLKVRFKFKENVDSNITYYFTKATFDFYGIMVGNSHTYSYFIGNKSTSDGSFKVNSISFIEDGYISVTGPNNELVGVYPGLDSMSRDDFDLFNNKFEDCETTDISCHIRNIQTALELIIVRIGNFFYNLIQSIINFFTYLFVPDFAHIDMYFNNLKTMLQDKFGFLNTSFDLLSYFKDSFLDLEPSTSFSFNGITMPIFNVQIVPAFSFDFSSILENSAINQAYNLLYLVLNGLLVLGFVKYCYNSIMDIVGGVTDGIG